MKDKVGGVDASKSSLTASTAISWLSLFGNAERCILRIVSASLIEATRVRIFFANVPVQPRCDSAVCCNRLLASPHILQELTCQFVSLPNTLVRNVPSLQFVPY